VSRDGDVVTTPELFRRIFEGEGATVHLRRSGEGVTAAEIISPQGGELTFPGLNMVAGRLSMDLLTRAVTAEGGVTITTTSEDGSTVTMRSDRMVIESQ
jgi:hypothetical protein